MKKAVLVLLLACAALPLSAAPYTALRGTWGNLANDINQWQYAPSMTAPTQGEFSVIADGTKNHGQAGLQVAVGTELTDNIRAELEYGYNGTTSLNGNFDYHVNGYTLDTQYQLKSTIQTLGVNVYYDFKNKTAFTPYLGVGFGVAAIREKALVKTVVAEMSANDYYYALTWNVNLGVGYALTERLSLDLGVRYSMLGGTENTSYHSADKHSASRSYSSILGSLGLRYNL